MNAVECITGRRSIRSFTDRKVSHETIEQIVSTASFAPSWKNTQITRYIAVEDADLKGKIAESTAGVFAGNGRIISEAPVLVAVTVVYGRSGFERDGSYSTDRKDGWQMFDAGIASEAFCLAAYEQGLGTVIMGIFDRPALTGLLQIPEDRELVALIALGYPAETPDAPKRKGVADLLTYM